MNLSIATTARTGERMIKGAGEINPYIEMSINPVLSLNTTPEKRLKNALEMDGIYPEVRQVFFAWPSLEKTCQQLASILTEYFPFYESGSILANSIRMATCDYKRSLFNGDCEQDRAHAFLRRLILSASQCVRWWVIGEGPTGVHYLRVLDDHTADWLRKHQITNIRFEVKTNCSDSDEYSRAVMLLAGKTLSVQDATPHLYAQLLNDIG